jgi:PAS domain S-box-containing protein
MKEDKPKPDKFGALRQRAEEVLQRQPEELREMLPEDIQHLSQTREQLVAELAELRQRIAELEASGAEHKRVEERLRFQANALYQIGDAVIAIDYKQRVTYLNQAAAGQYDVNPDDALGCKLTELYQYGWLKPEHEQAAYASLAEKGYWSGENIHIKRNGDRVYVESTVSVLQDDSGQDIGMLAVIRDLTQRKQAEEQILVANERLQYLLSSSSAVLYTAKASGDYGATFISENVTQMVGYEPREFLEESSFWIDHVHPEDGQRILTELPWIFEQGHHTYEYRFRRKDGTYIWMRDEMKLVRDEEGKPLEIIGYWIDITERKRAEEERERLLVQVTEARADLEEVATALERERDVLQTIMESTHAQLAYFDPQFNFVRVNSAYAQGSGYSKQELFGRNHFELFPHAENQAIFEQVRETGEPVLFHAKPFEFPDRPELGTTYWDWTLVPVKDRHGEVRGLVLSLLDVTEREQTMGQLDAERARLEAIIENAPEGIVVADEACRIVLTNSVADGIYARPVPYGEDFESHAALVLCHPDGTPYDPRDLPLTRSALDGETISDLEMAILWPDGQRRHLLVNSAPIRDSQGQVSGAVAVFQDITQRRRTLKVLQRRNRDLRLLNRLGRELGATLDLPQVLEQVLGAIREIIAAAGSSIWMWDEENPGWLVCRAAFHPELNHSPLNLRLRSGEGIAGWVAQRGESAIVSSARKDPRFSPTVDAQTGFQTHSMLAVPLRARGKIIGVLEVVNKAESRFSGHDRMLLETLGASAAIAIENAQLYDHARQAATAAERSRLARELHDAVSQTLFSASVIAESLPRLWERDPDKVRRGLTQLHQLTRGALAEMRTLLLELRPAALVDAELGDLLRQLTEAFASRTPVKVSLTVEGQRSLPPGVQIALYRMTQEALNNVTKHARATQVTVSLRSQPKGVELRIKDDGRGFDPDRVRPGRLGLNILRERAEAIGATLRIISQADQGTEVAVIWSDTQQRERKAND